VQEKLQLKNAWLTAVLPTVLKISKEIAKELLFLHRILSWWIDSEFNHHWFGVRWILETMIRARGQVNRWIARPLHDPSVRRVGSCGLVPDASSLFDKKFFGLEKV
jgi:hypothetical protein